MKSKKTKFIKTHQAQAMCRNVPMAPRKLRLMADHVRNLSVEQAVTRLSCSPLKSARIIRKALEAAIANAEHNSGADVDLLRVTAVHIDGARTLKRLKPRARGRADRILKRTSHVMLQVAEAGEVHDGS
ncbi:MAG: 50S ribosomal protein L22 [Candidatus Porifericomitaceae bacterium WSBS_2022_MAG_OTU9]